MMTKKTQSQTTAMMIMWRIMWRGMIQTTHMKTSIDDDSEPILERRRVCVIVF